MDLIRKIFGSKDLFAQEFHLHINLVSPGNYGVYANEVVIAVHKDLAAAEAHCQRLLDQQALDSQGGAK